jgi:cob(I)alamin adenosyltransferase
VALSYGLLDEQPVVDAIRTKPEALSLVLTGRAAPAAVIEAADTVTEMRKIKHAFEAGVRARRGIEF